MLNVHEILASVIDKTSKCYAILIPHSEAVRDMALKIADKFKGVDKTFIAEAAMLHDIGIVKTHAPTLGCFGDVPYLKHGEIGSSLLLEKGLEKHARVARCHIGMGLMASEIIENNMPLSPEDVLPHTLEEKIICYADNFFSKSHANLKEPSSAETLLDNVQNWGERSFTTFNEWHELFQLEAE